MTRVMVIDEEEDGRRDTLRELIDKGFAGYVTLCTQFHDQLDEEARARREAQEAFARLQDEIDYRVDERLERKYKHLLERLSELEEFRDNAEEKIDEAIDLSSGEARLRDICAMVAQYVGEVDRVRKQSSTAAACTLAMFSLRVLERWMTGDYNEWWLNCLRDNLPFCSQLHWLCRVACYIPRDDSPMALMVETHKDRMADFAQLAGIFNDEDIPDARWLSPIPEEVVEHTRRMPSPVHLHDTFSRVNLPDWDD